MNRAAIRCRIEVRRINARAKRFHTAELSVKKQKQKTSLSSRETAKSRDQLLLDQCLGAYTIFRPIALVQAFLRKLFDAGLYAIVDGSANGSAGKEK